MPTRDNSITTVCYSNVAKSIDLRYRTTPLPKLPANRKLASLQQDKEPLVPIRNTRVQDAKMKYSEVHIKRRDPKYMKTTPY